MVAIAAFVFMMAKDMKEIVTEISNSPTVKPFMDWMYPSSGQVYRAKRKGSVQQEISSPFIGSAMSKTEDDEDYEDKKVNPLEDPALDVVRRKLQLAGFTSMSTGEPASTSDFNGELW